MFIAVIQSQKFNSSDKLISRLSAIFLIIEIVEFVSALSIRPSWRISMSHIFEKYSCDHLLSSLITLIRLPRSIRYFWSRYCLPAIMWNIFKWCKLNWDIFVLFLNYYYLCLHPHFEVVHFWTEKALLGRPRKSKACKATVRKCLHFVYLTTNVGSPRAHA